MGTGHGKIRVETYVTRKGTAVTTASVDVQDEDPLVRSYFEQAMSSAVDGIGQSQVRTCGQIAERHIQNDFERVERANLLSSTWYGSCNEWLGNNSTSELSFDSYYDYCINKLHCGLSKSEIKSRYNAEKNIMKSRKQFISI